MELWRISNYKSLEGIGGTLFSGRWHTVGRPVVYLAGSASSALLETLAHLEPKSGHLPATYRLLQVSAPEETSLTVLQPALPMREWVQQTGLTRNMGDQWLASGASALARVPSALVPSTFNFLLNPMHGDAAKIAIVGHQAADIDARLLANVIPGSKAPARRRPPTTAR